MFTVLKVRDVLPASGDAAPYVHPPGTQARRVSTDPGFDPT